MDTLPLWFLSVWDLEHGRDYAPGTEPSVAVAFSAPDKVLEFANSFSFRTDRIPKAVNGRDELIELIVDLHRRGIKKICIDPLPDGTGGKMMSLAALLAFANSPR